MAPPTQYSNEAIAAALVAAYSLHQAASLIGMSTGALRKRALNDAKLRPLALACLERGKSFALVKCHAIELDIPLSSEAPECI